MDEVTLSTVENQGSSLNPTSGAILGILSQFGPLNANALSRTAKGRIGDYWTVTRSQVYRELATLANRGFVTYGPSGPRDSRDCEITEAGREAFLSWLDQGPADDVIRFPILLTVKFARFFAPGRLEEILDDFAGLHRERLAEYRLVDAAYADDEIDRYDRATLRFGILFEEAIEKWVAELPELLGPG